MIGNLTYDGKEYRYSVHGKGEPQVVTGPMRDLAVALYQMRVLAVDYELASHRLLSAGKRINEACGALERMLELGVKEDFIVKSLKEERCQSQENKTSSEP